MRSFFMEGANNHILHTLLMVKWPLGNMQPVVWRDLAWDPHEHITGSRVRLGVPAGHSDSSLPGPVLCGTGLRHIQGCTSYLISHPKPNSLQKQPSADLDFRTPELGLQSTQVLSQIQALFIVWEQYHSLQEHTVRSLLDDMLPISTTHEYWDFQRSLGFIERLSMALHSTVNHLGVLPLNKECCAVISLTTVYQTLLRELIIILSARIQAVISLRLCILNRVNDCSES